MFAFDIELTFESEDSILSATFALSTASEYFSRMSLSFSLSHEFKSSFDYNIFIFFFFFSSLLRNFSAPIFLSFSFRSLFKLIDWYVRTEELIDTRSEKKMLF